MLNIWHTIIEYTFLEALLLWAISIATMLPLLYVPSPNRDSILHNAVQ